MNMIDYAKQLQQNSDGDNWYENSVKMGKLVSLIAIAEQLERQNNLIKEIWDRIKSDGLPIDKGN